MLKVFSESIEMQNHAEKVGNTYSMLQIAEHLKTMNKIMNNNEQWVQSTVDSTDILKNENYQGARYSYLIRMYILNTSTTRIYQLRFFIIWHST